MLKNHHIDEKDIEWITLTKVWSIDVVGKVFRYKGKIFRAVHPEMVDYVQTLFRNNVISTLVKRGLLIDTRITSMRMNDFPLILWHKKIPHITKPAFWPWDFYKHAALKFIELNEVLMQWGLGTCDGHQENIMMHNNCSPVFIDLGSILPLQNSNNGLTSLEQFKRCFFNVLLLRAQRPELDEIIREICYTRGPIFDNEYKAITGKQIEAPYHNRSACLKFYKSIISKLEFSEKKSFWSGYHNEKDFQDVDAEYSDDTRAKILSRILETHRPSSMVDIAANAGKFSLIAAKLKSKVYAFDKDPVAINNLYNRVSQTEPDSNIAVGVHGIFGGDRYNFWQRPVNAKGEMALSLAISHHLFLGQKLPMNFIAKTLSSYCEKELVTEFMPFGLGSVRYAPAPLPTGYTLEGHLNEFQGIFRNVKILFYPTLENWAFRILLIFGDKICEGKNVPLEKTYIISQENRINKNNYILRILCPECNNIFHLKETDSIMCPHCNNKLDYFEKDNLYCPCEL